MNLLKKISRGWTSSLYNTGIRAYRWGVGIAALRSRKARLMRRGHHSIREYLDSHISPQHKYIWIHTSSLGEFEQGRPLMERIRAERPELKILLTFFSPSGYEVRHNWPGADAVCYLPFDLPDNVEWFINKVQPVAAIFVKYEFWRNYLMSLQRRRVPTFLISGIFRPGQVFFRKGGEWYRNLLRCFTSLMVQDDRSLRLLRGIGIENVTVCGDTRFDRVSDILNARRSLPILEKFCAGHSTIFMAGSSWPADEQIYIPWLKAHPEVKAVIAPHEFDKDRIRHLADQFPGRAVSWTQAKTDPEVAEKASILIMDCFGLLSAAYRYADIAYVGGGFGAGLHNINEAAVYGIPVIYGPNNAKFIEARELRQAGGGFQVNGVADFADVASALLDPSKRQRAGNASGAYIRSKLGATQRCWDIMAPQI